MTLYTTDYLEYYLPLVGWAGNNGIWSILVASGVFALPFVVIVVQEWLRAYLPANMRRTAKCLGILVAHGLQRAVMIERRNKRQQGAVAAFL